MKRRDLSIKRKIRAVIMLTTVVVLVVSFWEARLLRGRHSKKSL